MGHLPKCSRKEDPILTQKCEVSGENSSRETFKLTIPPLPQAGRWIFQFGKNVESPNEASLFELPNACGIKVCCPTNTFFRIHIDTNFDDFNQRMTHWVRNELYLSNEMALDGTRVASMISAMKRNFHNIASKKAM